MTGDVTGVTITNMSNMKTAFHENSNKKNEKKDLKREKGKESLAVDFLQHPFKTGK